MGETNRIIWTDFALKKLEEIHIYYSENASEEIAEKIINGILNKAKTLKNNPLSGSKEEFLKSFPNNFRRLIYDNYKIVYWLKEKDLVEIVHIFDSRQHPKKLKKFKN